MSSQSSEQKQTSDDTSNLPEDDQLHIIVHGVSPEPDEKVPKLQILRKCFLVSSFIPHIAPDTADGIPVVSVIARIPRRMEELPDATENIQMTEIELDAPALTNVPCQFIPIDEDIAIPNLISQCVNTFDLDRRRIIINKDTDQGVNELENQEDNQFADVTAITVNVASPLCDLSGLVEWILTDEQATENMSHWPDLLPKFIVLICILWSRDWTRFLIFCNDSFSGEAISNLLNLLGLSSAYVSGRISQLARSRYLAQLANGELAGLVCTDVLSRGIDVPEINLVISIDLPDEKDTVLHRIGRAGRFEREGHCFWLVRCHDEVHTLKLFSVQTGFILQECRLLEEKENIINQPEDLPLGSP